MSGTESVAYEDFFHELAHRLAPLSHSEEALRLIEESVGRAFKKTAQRQLAFSHAGAIVRPPIRCEDALASGILDANEDPFVMLQGDIVTTESAFFMGERISGERSGEPLFCVMNSTCDLVPNRRRYASLLRVTPVTGTPEEKTRSLQQLLSFRGRRELYLPPFAGEATPSIGYAVQFDGLAQIRLEDLLLARRLCSLSLVGWRIFGAFTRAIFARAGERESGLRSPGVRQLEKPPLM